MDASASTGDHSSVTGEPSSGDAPAVPELRRSQRRNKYHLDISAIRTHSFKNPDRRRSPSPPPPKSSAKRNLGESTLKRKLEKDKGGQLTPLPPPTPAATAHGPAENLAEPSTSKKAVTPSGFSAKTARVKKAHLLKPPTPSGPTTAEETPKEPIADLGAADSKPCAHELKSAIENKNSDPEEGSAAAATEFAHPIKLEVPESSTSLGLIGLPAGEGGVELPNAPVFTAVEAQEDQSQAIHAQPILALALVPITFSLELTATQQPAEGLLDHSKRKRKPPPHHRDFQPTSANGESSDDERDEEIFKTAKIEYTNADGSKSLDDFACTKCPAQFESRVGLTNHMNVGAANRVQKLHGANKEYPCEICDFSCTNKKTMRVHRKIHGVHKKLSGLSPRKRKPPTEEEEDEEGGDAQQVSPISTTSEACSSQESGAAQPVSVTMKHPKKRGKTPKEKSEEEGPKHSPPRLPPESEMPSAECGRGTAPTSGDDSMPVLESEIGQREVYSHGDESNDPNSKLNVAGSKSNRGLAIKCPECPFRTRSQIRLTPHMSGHTRKSGYQCPMCSFKTESAGFLRRHCDLHGQSYSWPPQYVGLPQDQLDQQLDLLLSGEKPESSTDIGGEGSSKGQQQRRTSGRKSKPPSLFSNAQAQPEPPSKRKRDEKLITCHELDCGFRCERKRELICHALAQHKIRKPGRRSRNQHVCKQCGALVCGYGQLILHKQLFHRAGPCCKLYRQLLDERLRGSIPPEWSEDCHEESTTSEQRAIPLSEVETRFLHSEPTNPDAQFSSGSDHVSEAGVGGGAQTEKDFQCPQCPYAANQKIKLERHVNKHMVKAEHQCPHCTYSCRSAEILQQHIRLHNKLLEDGALKAGASPIASPSASAEAPSESGEIPAEPAGRKTEDIFLQCSECPYKSRHGCDMKAHRAMHTMPPRTYACKQCTYSTLRENALKTHELLHEGIEPHHFRAFRKRGALSGSKARKLKLKVIRSKRYGVSIGWKMRKDGERVESSFYRCRFCPTEMSWMDELVRHARHHFTEEETEYSCGICSFRTDLEERMDEHFARAHNRTVSGGDYGLDGALGGERALAFKCSDCPFTSDTYGKLWHHQQKHRKASRFSCSKCSFSAGSIQCLSEHVVLHSTIATVTNTSSSNSAAAGMSRQVLRGSDEMNGLEAKNGDGPLDLGSAPTKQNSTNPTQAAGESMVPVAETLPVAQRKKRGTTTRKAKYETKEERNRPQRGKLEMETVSAGRPRTGRAAKMDKAAASSAMPSYSAVKQPFVARKNLSKLAIEIPQPQLSISRRLHALNEDAEWLGDKGAKTAADTEPHSSDSSSSSKLKHCPEPRCPFTCRDSILFKLHAQMHVPLARPFACTICSFNSLNVESLHSHLGLHVTPLSSSDMIQVRKRAMNRKKNGCYQNLVEMLPANVSAADILQCKQCSYKTLSPEKLMQHRLEHVQLLQQRLSFTMKRSANDDLSGKIRTRRHVLRKQERNGLFCSVCSFRCDSPQAFVAHRERHGAAAVFKCSLCDYASDTSSVTFFHEQNHHLEGTLTDLSNSNDRLRSVGCQGNNEPVSSSSRAALRCTKCSYQCNGLEELDRHWTEAHMGSITASAEDQEIGEMLKMRFVPSQFLNQSQSL